MRPVEIMVAYNPEKRTAVQIVPALCGVILTMTMVVFTATALVRERERGNLELLITTPVSPGELMAGKLLPYVAIGLIQTTLILALAYWLFGVSGGGPVRRPLPRCAGLHRGLARRSGSSSRRSRRRSSRPSRCRS